MQTITLKIEDELFNDVMNALEPFREPIQILNDQNLQLDPYFYERREKLHKILETKDTTVSHEALWDNVEKYLKSIKSK